MLCYIRVSSDGASARRKTASRLLTQLRGANAGRRRMRGGGPNSGEAALIEGDDFFGDFLRQRTPRRRKSSAPMRRALIGRQYSDG